MIVASFSVTNYFAFSFGKKSRIHYLFFRFITKDCECVMKFEETKLTYLVNFLRSFLIYIQLGTLLLKREESKWNPGSSTYFLLIVYHTYIESCK